MNLIRHIRRLQYLPREHRVSLALLRHHDFAVVHVDLLAVAVCEHLGGERRVAAANDEDPRLIVKQWFEGWRDLVVRKEPVISTKG